MSWSGTYPQITTPTNNDLFLIEQGNATSIITAANYKSWIGATSANLLNSDTTQSATAANTTETVFLNYSLPAATLLTDGWFIRIIAWGNLGTNNNQKTVRIKFGSSVFSSGAAAINNAYWIAESIIRRNSAGNQDMISHIHSYLRGVAWNNNLTGLGDFREPTSNLNSSVTIQVTGQSAQDVVVQASDVVYEGSVILLNS